MSQDSTHQEPESKREAEERLTSRDLLAEHPWAGKTLRELGFGRRFESRTWLETKGNRIIGMARNTEYDADGNLVSDVTEPTGVVVEIGIAPRKTLLQRIFG